MSTDVNNIEEFRSQLDNAQLVVLHTGAPGYQRWTYRINSDFQGLDLRAAPLEATNGEYERSSLTFSLEDRDKAKPYGSGYPSRWQLPDPVNPNGEWLTIEFMCLAPVVAERMEEGERYVKIKDNLSDIVERTKEEIREELLSYLNDNDDLDEAPEWSDLDYSGSLHEIVDGAVPIYTSNIDDLWYLHSSELEEAYERSGLGENARENNGMTAIFAYIDQEVQSWFEDNREDIFNEWRNQYCIRKLAADLPKFITREPVEKTINGWMTQVEGEIEAYESDPEDRLLPCLITDEDELDEAQEWLDYANELIDDIDLELNGDTPLERISE